MLGAAALGTYLLTSAPVHRSATTPLRPSSEATKDTTVMAKDLLPRHDAGTPEGQARQLLWTMSNVLSWHVPHPRAGTFVFRTAEDMAKVWAEHGGEPGKLPAVDFAQNMVVAVFEAEGSYREVRHVQRALQGDGKLWIVIGKSSRPWSMINPASVIVVSRADGEPVFLEAASQQAQDLLRGVGE
jgi:hypothetical protein